MAGSRGAAARGAARRRAGHGRVFFSGRGAGAAAAFSNPGAGADIAEGRAGPVPARPPRLTNTVPRCSCAKLRGDRSGAYNSEKSNTKIFKHRQVSTACRGLEVLALRANDVGAIGADTLAATLTGVGATASTPSTRRVELGPGRHRDAIDATTRQLVAAAGRNELLERRRVGRVEVVDERPQARRR